MKHCAKIIYEKSSIPISIPIPNSINIPTSMSITNNALQQSSIRKYGLQNQIFDPSQSSPPNIFMLKLHKRIDDYYTLDVKNNN